MPNWFNRPLKLPNVKHSVFDLSNDYKTSINIGQLVPVGLEEVLPSDKILQHGIDTFIRFAPLKFPVMHRIKVHTSNFFVPLRIVLGEDLYEKFLNNQFDLVPITITQRPLTISGDDAFKNTVFDYLGYDVLNPLVGTMGEGDERATSTIKLINPIPYLAYLCIVRDWYADSNIQSSFITNVDYVIDLYRNAVNGRYTLDLFSDSGSYSVVLKNFSVAYTKDYFNTARPQPQLGSEMYVLNRPFSLGGFTVGSSNVVKDTNFAETIGKTASPYLYASTSSGQSDFNESTTIRDLWKKEMLQRYLEVDNTFGSRIREKLAGHFGVRYSDQRIQIPLYCGGSSSYAQISEVLSHADTDNAVVGQYTGKAVVADRSRSKHVYFEEHGYYLTLLSLIPDNGYCRGEQRTLLKNNIFDFASPEFNNVGWQEIYYDELCVPASNGERVANRTAWGYQPRYSEYRSHPSRCTGNFRGVNEELAYHLNRNFDTVPPLNENFIQVSGTNRIFASQSVASDAFAPLYVDVYHNLKMSRPISYEPDSMHLY